MRYEEIHLDKPRKLRYDFNAVADIEQKADAGIGEIMSEKKIGFNVIRLMIWGGLKWEDPKLTPVQAGEILQKFLEGGGDITYISVLITKALEKSGILGKGEGKNAQTEAAK
jgi:hypothetical protein